MHLNIFKLIILFIFIGFGNSFGQIEKPVKWKFSVEQKEGSDEAILKATATLDKGWHIYSQHTPDGGPQATSVRFGRSNKYKLLGKVEESKTEKVFDKIFEVDVIFFSDKAVFTQKIKVNSDKDFQIQDTIDFQVCNDEKCLNESVEHSFKIKGVAQAAGIEAKSEVLAFPDSEVTKSTFVEKEQELKEDKPETSSAPSMSLLSIFISGFIGGFLALLTPCVFPMIPLTVSYFTKKDHSRVKAVYHAGIYGISIILIYVILGFGVTKLLGADALNELASNGIFNFVFFVLLLVFAFSFLGAFEITLPSSWINRADANSEKGGLTGMFFMAATLALVSFSCTGPIIGTLLVQAASGKNALGPLIGMTGFSLALALPFAFFAAFPSWMKTLPKSGGWLNSVKVVLGFLELALAFKFLSNVDLAYHWRFLDREVFLVLWIIIFTLLGFYLLGKLKFSHDSDVKFVSIPRLSLAIVSFAFALYMVPGLWGAPLKAISAFSPPQANQDFDLSRASYAVPSTTEKQMVMKKYSDTFHCPHNLNCFFDYEEGIAYAKKMNKPVFIDFTGWSCVNCRKMEVSVWSDPVVLKKLNEDFVLISLYVDDKTVMPENEQYVSTYSNKKIKTLGNKWSDIQGRDFGTNSQPYYVILDHEGKELTPAHAFDLNIQNFVMFLDKGKTAFKK